MFLTLYQNSTLYSEEDMIYSSTSENLKIKYLQRYQEMQKEARKGGRERESQTLEKKGGKY